MDIESVKQRIITIQSALPKLDRDLEALIKTYQRLCKHPYLVGWKKTSTGLVVTVREIGCPYCGLALSITGYHEARMPDIFRDKPVYWVNHSIWTHLFRLTVAQRELFLKVRNLHEPPQPA